LFGKVCPSKTKQLGGADDWVMREGGSGDMFREESREEEYGGGL